MADPYGQFTTDEAQTTLSDPNYRRMKSRISAPRYHYGGSIGDTGDIGAIGDLLSQGPVGIGLLQKGLHRAGEIGSAAAGGAARPPAREPTSQGLQRSPRRSGGGILEWPGGEGRTGRRLSRD